MSNTQISCSRLLFQLLPRSNAQLAETWLILISRSVLERWLASFYGKQLLLEAGHNQWYSRWWRIPFPSYDVSAVYQQTTSTSHTDLATSLKAHSTTATITTLVSSNFHFLPILYFTRQFTDYGRLHHYLTPLLPSSYNERWPRPRKWFYVYFFSQSWFLFKRFDNQRALKGS